MIKLSLNMKLLAVTAGTALAFTTTPSPAVTIGFTSRANLAGNDSVDWGIVGVNFDVIDNPFTINSAKGNTLTVSKTSASFERLDQGNGWAGNFSNGDRLLWTQGNYGPITINFAKPIQRVGSQFQANYYGDFTASITAFDTSGNTLGSFTRTGNSNGNSDGSAIFLGIGSDLINISRVEFNGVTAEFYPQDFAINTLSINNEVPEPLTVLGSITAAAFGIGLRRKYQQLQKGTAKV